VDEFVLAHGLKGIVRAALFAEGGDGFFADGPAAKRTRAVSGIDKALVRQPEEFVERIEQHAAEFCGRPAERGTQVGTADVADEQSVASEDGVGGGIAGVEVVNEDGDGLRSVAGGFERLQADAAELDDVALAARRVGVCGFGGGAEINRRARQIAQFQMSGDEIGVKVREEDVADLEGVFGGEGEVLADVALGINNCGRAGRFVSDQIGGVRQARQIELLENQSALPFAALSLG
jgi:hypothetical protein